jgi:hypothetical protein
LLRRLFGKEDWCCPGFRHLYERRYERDLFVFVRPWGSSQGSGFSFWLAFRSVRQQDRSRLAVAGLPRDVPVTISTSQRILYCPWCGVQLEQFYQGQKASLVDPRIVQEFELPGGEPETPG